MHPHPSRRKPRALAADTTAPEGESDGSSSPLTDTSTGMARPWP
jgi:hypothetical protein